MRFNLIFFGVLVATASANHHSTEHKHKLAAREVKKGKIFGTCKLTKNVSTPPFPSGKEVVEIKAARTRAQQDVKNELFGPANDQFPNWYYFQRYTGTATDPQATVITIPETDARISASVVADPTFVNADHVFERGVFNKFLTKMMGMGDHLVAVNFNSPSPAEVAECNHWKANFESKPPYYPAAAVEASKGLLNTVFQYLQGFDKTNLGRFPSGHFTGMTKELNSFKGMIMDAQLQSRYEAPDTVFIKGTDNAGLIGRMGDLEAIAAAFEYMNRPEVKAIHGKTTRRISAVLHGVDEYFATGNRNTDIAPIAPFRMANGAAYPLWANEFRPWLELWYSRCEAVARAFVRARVTELENLVDPRNTDPTITATAATKTEVLRRLNEFKTSRKNEAPFLTIQRDAIIVAPVAERLSIYRTGPVGGAIIEPFNFSPFTTVARP